MRKLLIIEDDQVVANIYRSKFSLEGFHVEVAFDGEVGLEMVKAFHPDLIVLDLMLPKMSGVEVLKEVRRLPEFERTPILVFSNTYLTKLVQDAWKAGATKCLSKSNCTTRTLLDVVRAALGMTVITDPPAEMAPTMVPANAITSAAPPAKTDTVPPAVWQLDEIASAAAAHQSGAADAEFQAALRQEFVASLPATVVALRAGLKTLVKADNDPARLQALVEIHQRVHPLTGNAAIAGLVHIAQLSEALEFLLKELIEKPRNLNVSILRTVANALDFLGFLFEHGVQPENQELTPPKILVVDDEAISRRAVTYSLEKARLPSEICDNPNSALELAAASRFDLVFLDVDMPGMSGFELCTKLRTLPHHQKTPVVFVTSLNDFESRANSSVSGGNDFIGKPFLFIELAVKALIHVQRGRLMPPS